MESRQEEIKNPESPGEMLRRLLHEKGWKQEELAVITGRSITAINNVATGRAGLTPEMAACLAAAFGNSPADWMLADTTYRLSLISEDTSEITRRSRLFSIAPIREMQRRGWISSTEDLDELELELNRFFDAGHQSLSVAARRSPTIPHLMPAESAWYFRARQIAKTLLAAPFSEERLSKAKSELRRLAAHPKEAKYLPEVLADYGVRFVVVEPLAGLRVDGAAMWDDSGPIIAVSIRHDRVDGFWFTVMHEFSHIKHGDPNSVDANLVDSEEGVRVRLATDEVEARADREAASSLIPEKELESFINRVGPLYPRDRIIQFANRIRIHPGIIVGQLQYRKELGYRAMRDQLAKIRDIVVSTALTDGWGQMISPSVTRRTT